MIMAHRKMEEIDPMGEYQRQGGLKEHRNRTNKYNKKRRSSTNKEQSGKLLGDRSGRREREKQRERERHYLYLWLFGLTDLIKEQASPLPLPLSLSLLL